jgi:sugar phosphate isomerase/epimerase
MIGRVNGYNYKIFTEAAKEIEADGFELMMVHAYYSNLARICGEIEKKGINIEVVHAEKDIGGLLPQGDPLLARKALTDFEINCKVASFLGAKKLVFHLWSAPDSDRLFEKNLGFLPELMSIADRHSVELLIENVPCSAKDPFTHLSRIEELYPSVRFIYDTRFGAFHEQTERFLSSPWLENGRIAHMHFSDFIGPAHDFKALRPIPHLTFGVVGFDSIMPVISEKYHSSITLESPEIHTDGTNVEKLNADLNYIRKWVCKK